MKSRSRPELLQEIMRVKVAISNTQSSRLRADYTKYLYRLQKQLRVIDYEKK